MIDFKSFEEIDRKTYELIIFSVSVAPSFCLFTIFAIIDSGAAIWMALGILYIFMMFSGKKLLFFLLLSFASFGVTYCLAYQFPELVVPMPSKAAVYFDSFFVFLMMGWDSGMSSRASNSYKSFLLMTK